MIGKPFMLMLTRPPSSTKLAYNAYTLVIDFKILIFTNQ